MAPQALWRQHGDLREEGLRASLQGKLILEVPVQSKVISKRILDHASDLQIQIRDINGKIYNP